MFVLTPLTPNIEISAPPTNIKLSGSAENSWNANPCSATCQEESQTIDCDMDCLGRR